MNIFPQGYRIKTLAGEELEIICPIGRGGQGTVYKVRCRGREAALKWYLPNRISDSARFYDNIRSNISKGPPTKEFLWPVEVTQIHNGSFGYVMELRPPDYKDFSQFLLAKEKFSGVGAVINSALNIVSGFRALHNRGYSYQDLNDGNFFINPKTGGVLICDNDNVAPYGESLGIAGKCRYMAPEIVTGKKPPDIHTDRFSLAVVLFMILFYNHPLEGKKTMCPCLTDELERRFYGTDPVFIYDPQDTSNCPVRGVHDNAITMWPIYPEFIRRTFVEAFSKSRLTGEDIEHRIIEKEWQESFLALRDITVKCACGEDTFIDAGLPKSNCVNCGAPIARPPLLEFHPKTKFPIPLYPGSKIYKRHIDANVIKSNAAESGHNSSAYNSTAEGFMEPVGEVVRSRLSPDVWGIRNLSDTAWTGTSASGRRRSISKGEGVAVEPGYKIDFGNVQAEIIYRREE